MRVAYVCADPGIPVFGRKGASVHVQEVVRALRRRGATVELFATRFGGEPPADLIDVAVHALPPVSKGPLAERERAAFRANAALRAALDAAVATRGRFDLVYERYSLWSIAGMSHARTSGSAGVLEVNAPLIDEQRRHRGLADPAGAERCARLMFGAATRVVAVSTPVAGWVRDLGAPAERVVVVPNGVDPGRFRLAAATAGRSRAGLTVGFVGTLKPWHGVDLLVDAVARLVAEGADARLLLVGDGPERAALESRAAAHGLGDRVEWTGAVDPGAVPALLGRMDVGCAPYPDLPGFYFSPLKLYEYLAAALPVVASRIGQVTDVITHGRTGLLHRPGDLAGVTAALRSLLDDPAGRVALGRAGRARVTRSHTWDAAAGRILAAAGVRSEPGRREVA